MKESSHVEETLRQRYTEAAKNYDETRFVAPVEEYMHGLLRKLLDVKEGILLLDVAAGTGRTAVPFAETGAKVIAIDLTPAMLEKMRLKTERLRLDNLSIYQVNARALPFSDDAFDAVISLRFFHLLKIEEQAAILREMHRVLKPGGKLLVEYNNSALLVANVLYDFVRRLRGQQPLSRISRRHVRDLYQDYMIIHWQGFSWPLIGSIAKRSPSVAKALLKLSAIKGIDRYARVTWVISGKPSTDR